MPRTAKENPDCSCVKNENWFSRFNDERWTCGLDIRTCFQVESFERDIDIGLGRIHNVLKEKFEEDLR